MIERRRTSPGDNYSYVLYDEPGGDACLVDPVATEAINQVLEDLSLNPIYLVNTHGHGDHTGGNNAFRSRVEEIICHPAESSRVQGVSRTVRGGETLTLNSLSMTVLHTPGHTSGSICLKTSSDLIAGDTVFLSGCGNPKFGGNTRELFETFKNKLRPLEDDLLLHPGHDYAERNLKFAREVDPENTDIERKLQEVKQTDEPTSTLGEEKQYNPFFRYDKAGLIEQLEGLPDSPSERTVFEYLRDLRNQW